MKIDLLIKSLRLVQSVNGLNILAADMLQQQQAELEQLKAQQPVKCCECIHRHSSEFCECRSDDAFCSDGELKQKENNNG